MRASMPNSHVCVRENATLTPVLTPVFRFAFPRAFKERQRMPIVIAALHAMRAATRARGL